MPKSTTTLFVGLDVPKDSISLTYASSGSREGPVFLGPSALASVTSIR